MDFHTLKTKQREIRSRFPSSLGLRVHRSLSWYNKYTQCDDDTDAQFVFLWIAFNAAYSQVLASERFTEQQAFQQFIEKLCYLDTNKHISRLLWDEFSSSIRMLIDNQYVFQPFWDAQNQMADNTDGNAKDWKMSFQKAKVRANKALEDNNSPALLSIILSRLYTLRNQIIHGGATWQSSANREQLRDGVNFLSKLVPILINIMMDNPNELWGEAHYPYVE